MKPLALYPVIYDEYFAHDSPLAYLNIGLTPKLSGPPR
jgi:hypothetical protein